jgi:hypothetical protein
MIAAASNIVIALNIPRPVKNAHDVNAVVKRLVEDQIVVEIDEWARLERQQPGES